MPDPRRTSQTRNFLLADCGLPPRDRRNQRWIIFWWLSWMVTWLLVLYAVKVEWLPTGIVANLAALGSSLLAIGGIVAYRRYLRDADELRRKIELDALAAAFGVGVVGGLVYWLFAEIGALPEAGLLEVVMAMILTHSTGVVAGQWRYS